MHLNDYQMLAQRTSPIGHDRILNGVMGMAGEAGECVDHLKKSMFQGHELDREKLKKELGDVMWVSRSWPPAWACVWMTWQRRTSRSS